MIIAIIAIPLFVLAELLEVFHWPAEQTGAHELAFESAFLLLAFGMFSWRRWKELREEIGERKRAEEALRGSEKRYRMLVETVPHGIEDVDTSGVITFANAAHHRQYEHSEGELVGMSILDFVALDSEREPLREYLKRLAKEQPTPTPYFGQKKTKSGRLIDVEVAWDYKRDATRQVTGFISVITDISERKRAEEALREMALFAELNPAPVVRFNREGEVIFANPAARSILGIEAREGASLTSLLPAVADIDLEHCVREGSVIGAEIAVGQRHFNLVILGLPDLDIGHIYGSDISDRKRAEEALLQAKDELEDRVAQRTAELEKANAGLRLEIKARQDAESRLVRSAKLAAVGQLAAGVAHELNNPLGAIVGYAQLISEDAALSPANKAQLDRIILRAQGAAKVVGELREFAAPAEMEKASTDIHDVVEGALSLVEQQLRLDNIAVVRSYGPGLPAIECDSDRIEQVFVNLILNAKDAMLNGGTLTVSTEVSGDGQDVAVVVSDTGVGIASEDHGRLFEPFYTAGKAKGTGLGLSISQRIVEEHGGRMEMESEPGRGSRFTVWLAASASEKVSRRAVA